MRALVLALLFALSTGAVLVAWPRCIQQVMGAGERFGASLGLMRLNGAPLPRLAEVERLPPSVAEPRVLEEPIASEPDNGARKLVRRVGPHKPMSLRSLRVPAETVLKWVEQRRTPKGHSVVASGTRPSGIELSDVAAFAAGVEDGDVLFDVNGTPVSSHDDVVASVIAAQSARAPTISARFWRDGEVFRLTVELPYLDSSGKLQHDYGNVANGQLR